MVKSGLKVVDDLNNLGHLNHFLEGQVGLIYKLNYLDVTQISLNFFIIIGETRLLSQAVLKHVRCPKI